MAEGRKRVEPMARMFGGALGVEPEIDQSVVLSWQRFLTVSPWEAQAVQQEIQAVFNEEFVPTTCEWAIGRVGVIDGSSFVKPGKERRGRWPSDLRGSGSGRCGIAALVHPSGC